MEDKKGANTNDADSLVTSLMTDSSDSNDINIVPNDTSGSDNAGTTRATEVYPKSDAFLAFKTLTEDDEIEKNPPAERCTTDVKASKALRDENETHLNQTAGDIFLKQIVNEVVEETTELQEEVTSQSPLLDFFSTVQLRFGTVNVVAGAFRDFQNPNEVIAQALDGNDVSSDQDRHEVISTTFHDAVVGDSILIFQLVDCKPIPLSMMGKGVLLVSNQAALIFNLPSGFYPLRINVDKDAGDPRFFISLFAAPKLFEHKTEGCLRGQIKLLSEDDHLTVANNNEEENAALITKYLLSGGGLNSPNAVFVPKVLKILSTPAVKDRLHLVKSAGTIAIPKSLHVSNEFRLSIIDAIGTKSDIALLRENCALKFKKEAITLIQKMIGDVSIDHDGKLMKHDLRDGRFVPRYNGGDVFRTPRPAWVVPVTTRAFYNDANSLAMSISGVELGAAGFAVAFNSWPDGIEKFYCMFDPYALVKSIKSSDREPRYILTEIAFWFDRIEKTLNVLGIDCNDAAQPNL
jgi:hypothetical protein